MIISLLGYMGSGKSHISKILSIKTNLPFMDLDKEISESAQLSLPEIFEKKGELYFRKTEKEILEQLLLSKTDGVLSVGGGTPVYYNNMDTLNAQSITFYLRASVGTLAERLKKGKHKRPLIARFDDDELPEFIAKHLFERNPYYHQAQHIIDTDAKTPEEIVDEIWVILQQYP